MSGQSRRSWKSGLERVTLAAGVGLALSLPGAMAWAGGPAPKTSKPSGVEAAPVKRAKIGGHAPSGEAYPRQPLGAHAAPGQTGPGGSASGAPGAGGFGHARAASASGFGMARAIPFAAARSLVPRTGCADAGGCRLGWRFAQAWSDQDQSALAEYGQRAFSEALGRRVSFVAPDSQQRVTLTTEAAPDRSLPVEFAYMSNVVPPADGARVIAAPFLATGALIVLAGPGPQFGAAPLGVIDSGEAVDVVGTTPDGQWAMIGDSAGVVVGYVPMSRLTATRHLDVDTVLPHPPDSGDAAVSKVPAPAEVAPNAPAPVIPDSAPAEPPPGPVQADTPPPPPSTKTARRKRHAPTQKPVAAKAAPAAAKPAPAPAPPVTATSAPKTAVTGPPIPVAKGAQSAPPGKATVTRETVRASTQCKSLIAVTGDQKDIKTGCAAPNGDWPIA